MTKPIRDEKEQSLEGFLSDDDEIEILEVIGLDEDGAPVAPVEEAAPPSEPDEYVVDLDEEADEVASSGGVAVAATDDATGVQRDQLLRLQADFDNYKKRVEREREANRRIANLDLISRLLDVLDNFERAVAAARESEADQTFRDGVILIFRQLLDELRKEGLTSIDSIGEPFDPTRHDAVQTDPNSDLPHHTVVEELQRGYLLHDRLLRPSLVKVSTRAADDGDGE